MNITQFRFEMKKQHNLSSLAVWHGQNGKMLALCLNKTTRETAFWTYTPNMHRPGGMIAAL